MRLFLALVPDSAMKAALLRAAQTLRETAVSGNFTADPALFHVTVAFLGETSRLRDVQSAMSAIESPPVPLRLSRGGRFRNPGGDIWWCGAGDSPLLGQLAVRTSEALSRYGFRLETRSFRPHFTLGRQAVLPAGFDSGAFFSAIPPLECQVNKLTLMKSERIGGRLVYTPVASKNLR